MIHRSSPTLLLCTALATILAPVVASAGPRMNAPALESAAGVLADQVRSISKSTSLSQSKKERLIANAVRSAVVGAVQEIADTDNRLQSAIELTSAATQAAPGFRETILRASSLTPEIQRIPGASQALRSNSERPAAALRSAAAPTRQASAARPRVSSASAPYSTAGVQRVYPNTSARNTATPSARTYSREDDYRPAPRRNASAVALEEKGKITWLLDSNVRYDNNIYLTKENKESDTTFAIRPGVEMKTGENSRTSAKLVFREAFTRTARKTAPSETLATGQGDVSYVNGRSRFSLSANLDQSNQNNRDVVIDGRKEIFRTDTFNAQLRGEFPFTGKSSAGVGLQYSSVNYPDGVFQDNRSWEAPLNYYYAVSPKVDLSSGVSIRRTTTSGSSDRSQSYYYNVGARGEFAPTLQGEATLGYRRLTSTSSDTEGALGFSAALRWSVTPKSGLNLSLNRDFRTSAQGQSITNSQYSLSYIHSTTPFWQNGASASLGKFEYGTAIFSGGTAYLNRKDRYTEGSLFSQYQFTRWLSGSFNVSYRNNNSNLQGVDFDGYLLSLMLGLAY